MASIDLAELVFGFEEQFPIRYRHQMTHTRQLGTAQVGFLKETLPIRQTNKWLWMKLTRDWPEPRASTATKNGGDQA